jgi:hypothetical protein
VKKNVIFVNSLFNLIVACQIRNELFGNESFDIVVSDESPGLYEIYQTGELEKVFDRVFYADTNSYNKGRINYIYNKAKMLSNPGKVYCKLIGKDDFIEYTDIFFWNPDVVFYSYYMEMNHRKKKSNIHVYSDAMAGYFLDAPDRDHPGGYHLFRTTLANEILEKKYSWKCVYDMDFDYYMFSPKMYFAGVPRRLVEIPSINKRKAEYLNVLFKQYQVTEIKEKYIFFERPWQDSFDENINLNIIRQLVDVVGKENVAIKTHPRSNRGDYLNLHVHVIEGTYPWEIYEAAYSTNGKVLLTVTSSGLLMSNLIYEGSENGKKVFLYKLVAAAYKNTKELGNIGTVVSKVKENFGDIYVPETWEEFHSILAKKCE